MLFRSWNDRWLKRYTTALFKRQWGENLKKFGGIQLIGGTTLNGQVLYDEAIQEIDKIEAQMQDYFMLPPMMQIG